MSDHSDAPEVLRFALVGCGRIARRHAELLGTGAIAGAELVAVCDTDWSKAEALGKQYNVPHFGVIGEMMSVGPTIDVVSILTESGRHAENVIEVAGYAKHIVVEKPMALTLDDADQMIEACAESGSRLFVVKQNRFNVPIVKTRMALEQGRFGKLVMGTVRVRWCRRQDYYDESAWRGTWAWDGGVLTNQASHHIDVLEWMMGDVESVFAKSTTALVDIEVEDTAVVILKFTSGALGIIEATTATRPTDLEGSLSILGEQGAVEVGGFALNEMKTWRFEDSTEEDAAVITEFSVNPPDVYGYGHRAYYEHVVSCIRSGDKQLVDGLEGRRSLELISAIYESVETGHEVQLRFRPQECRLGIR
jgi:predicted dehydrogenase